MEHVSDPLRSRMAELVRNIYAGAINPSEYNRIFEAWDAHFALVGGTEATGEGAAEDFDWVAEFADHFEQAGQIFDRLHPQRGEGAPDALDAFHAPAMICSARGVVQRANAAAQALLGPVQGRGLDDLPFDTTSAAALRSLMTRAPDPAPAARCVVRLFPEGDEPCFFYAEFMPGRGEDPGPRQLMLRAVASGWSPAVETVLAAAFDLTEAETALVSELYRGHSIKEIAEARNRSQATLRTQLSSVLQKTGVKSQAGLARIVTGLMHLVEQRDAEGARIGAPVLPRLPDAQRTIRLELEDDITVEVVESGALDGDPVYFIQPTTLPTLTPALVAALRARGLRVLSPMRPGTGATTRLPIQFSPRDWAGVHLQVLDRLGIGEAVIGGHCSGGIYALELARAAGARCRRVVLVDTGAPLADATQIYRMPAAPRRLFLAARYFGAMIDTPIKLVAADFFSGPEGEARGVAYFYEGSPADQAILHAGDNWRITRDNMDYCFANVPQLCQDIRIWSRNNSRLLEEVVQRVPVHFLQGEQNLVHDAAMLRKLCARHPRLSCHIEPDAAQLLIYVRPELLAEAFAHRPG